MDYEDFGDYLGQFDELSYDFNDSQCFPSIMEDEIEEKPEKLPIPDIPPQVTFASPKFIYDSNGTVKAIFFQSLQLLKGFVKANKELIKDFVIVLPLDALGAIRIDYRRKDFSNYLLSPTLINAPSS